MTGIVDQLLSAPAWLVYATVGLLVFLEDAVFIGFILPGETAAVIGGVSASRGHVDVGIMIAVVVVSAIVGDSVGYEVGRHLGTRVLQSRHLTRHQDRLTNAQDTLSRKGGTAVFLGRFVAFLRAVMPALAGTSHMPYRKFLVFNAAGGLVWGVAFVLLGYLAGNSYAKIESIVGRDLAVVVAVIVVVALIFWRFRRRRSAERPPTGD
jgi:membrane-associated protein